MTLDTLGIPSWARTYWTPWRNQIPLLLWRNLNEGPDWLKWVSNNVITHFSQSEVGAGAIAV